MTIDFLTNENITRYKGMIPGPVVSRFSEPDHHGIAIREGEELIGSAVFSLENDSEGVLSAVLQWIYVVAEHRGEGYGHELYKELMDAIRSKKAGRLYVDLLRKEQMEEIRRFFAHMGVTFSRVIKHEYVVSLKQLMGNESLAKIKDIPGLTGMNGIERDSFEEAVKLAMSTGRKDVNEGKLYSSNRGLSSILEVSGGVGAVLFISLDNNGELSPICYASKKGVPDTVLFALLKKSLVSAEKVCRIDTRIRILCRDEKMVNMVHYFFPKAKPRRYYRGYIVVG